MNKPISALSESGTVAGYTRDESWASDWRSFNPERSYSALSRIDRPPGITCAIPSARVPIVVKPNFGHHNSLEIHFDGGCRPTNPGNRYGSFCVKHCKRVVFQNERAEFGRGTNNEAEFLALIAGLDWSLVWLPTWSGRLTKYWRVKMVTDSQIVRGRVTGSYSSNKTEPQQRMAALTAQVHLRLEKFGEYEIEWRGRKHNVQLFGH